MKRLVIIAALGLAACQPEHAEWQSRCVEDHLEPYPMVQLLPTGPNGQLMPMTTIQYRTVCDRYQRVCVPGRDGSTKCGVDHDAD